MRGRKKLKVPNAKHLAILEALMDGHRKAHVANVYEMSRQSVQSIVDRWPEYAPKRKKRKR